MIFDLRNPTLKPRHWEAIEEIIAFHFTPEEPMTLGKLVELDAFQHIEAIQEVSGRASSEASLEAILKKVRLGNTLNQMFSLCQLWHLIPHLYQLIWFGTKVKTPQDTRYICCLKSY